MEAKCRNQKVYNDATLYSIRSYSVVRDIQSGEKGGTNLNIVRWGEEVASNPGVRSP